LKSNLDQFIGLYFLNKEVLHQELLLVL